MNMYSSSMVYQNITFSKYIHPNNLYRLCQIVQRALTQILTTGTTYPPSVGQAESEAPMLHGYEGNPKD